MTSEALMTAVTSLPSRRPSSRAASMVMEATRRWPLTSISTLAIAAPSVTRLTVPASWLRALSFMVVAPVVWSDTFPSSHAARHWYREPRAWVCFSSSAGLRRTPDSVQARLVLAPGGLVVPVARDLLDQRERHALRQIVDGLLLRPARRREACAYVVEICQGISIV